MAELDSMGRRMDVASFAADTYTAVVVQAEEDMQRLKPMGHIVVRMMHCMMHCSLYMVVVAVVVAVAMRSYSGARGSLYLDVSFLERTRCRGDVYASMNPAI